MAHGRMSIKQQSQEQTESAHSQDSGAWGQHEEKVLRHSEHEMRSQTDKEYNSQKMKYPNGHFIDTIKNKASAVRTAYFMGK